MPTTTATTGPPPLTDPGEGLTVRQRVSPPCIADAVRARIRDLHDRGELTITPADCEDLAETVGRPAPWITDHLLVLEGSGILKPVRAGGARAWTVDPASEYLR